MPTSRTLYWALLSLICTENFGAVAWRTPQDLGNSFPVLRSQQLHGLSVRGGHQEKGDGEERYSRQVYTLGARAHGIFRSSTTVILDGHSSSGLLYETGKNLALLGVGRLILVENSAQEDPLDDLGKAYQRNARAELGGDNQEGYDLLRGYLQRLNPQLQVTTMPRSEISIATEKTVYVAVDKVPEPNEASWPIVTVETAGVFGRVQCDFGDNFVVYDADGEPPISIPLDRLECNEDREITVFCIKGEQHDVSVGDALEFQLRSGSVVCPSSKVTGIETPERFRMRVEQEDSRAFCNSMNENAAIVRRRKVPQQVSFLRLTDIDLNNDSLFAPCDLAKSFDVIRRRASMACFTALEAFQVENDGRLPSWNDRGAFLKLIPEELDAQGVIHVDHFLRGCAAKFSPLQAVFGAIAAQETLKAATGLYTPITQVLLYDCDEVLDDNLEPSIKPNANSRTPALRYIMGDSAVEELQNQQLFVVGAGAIGCELLKNLAPLGIKKVVVTDMDTIEPSNLSRQLLFRDSDIGKFKSLAAKEAAQRLEPTMDIEAHSSRVGSGDDNPFDEEFWSRRVDVVLNALDNVEARMYIDSQCVANHKPLVDAGTMGPKGNVQVVIPNVSESYASSVDPPEPSIPVCTLKNFPYAISHTIQWGRDLFDGMFRRRPNQANEMAMKLKEKSKVRALASQLIQDKGPELAMDSVGELIEDVSAASDTSPLRVRAEALVWAARLANKLYYVSSSQLLDKHPIGSTDEDGDPFWSGTRRPPKLVKFNAKANAGEGAKINENLLRFVQYAAQLRVESILTGGEESEFSTAEAKAALEACQAYPINEGSKSQTHVRRVLSRCAEIEMSSSMKEVEFEKDDDIHASFCTAASNLRAIAYGIPPADVAETRRIAGRIIPAMITTTALVSGLSCIELIKSVQDRQTAQFRNSFLNLALNFYAFTAPVPAPDRPGFRGQEYTLWDRWELQESRRAAERGGVRLNSIRRRVQKLAFPEDPDMVEVVSISLGPVLVYSNFMHDSDSEVMNSSLWERLEMTDVDDDDDDGTCENIDTSGPFVDLEVLVEDIETGDAIELPVVRVKRAKTNI